MWHLSFIQSSPRYPLLCFFNARPSVRLGHLAVVERELSLRWVPLAFPDIFLSILAMTF